jgi:hypothetical protein
LCWGVGDGSARMRRDTPHCAPGADVYRTHSRR